MVADRAMVSAPTVYNYFGTKPALLLAIISQAETETASKIKCAADVDKCDPVDEIVDFLNTMIGVSLSAVDAKTWQHAYSQITLCPGSDAKDGFKGINDNLYNSLEKHLQLLIDKGKLSTLAKPRDLRGLIERVNFSLFGELISTDSLTLENYAEKLRKYVVIIIRQYCV